MCAYITRIKLAPRSSVRAGPSRSTATQFDKTAAEFFIVARSSVRLTACY